MTTLAGRTLFVTGASRGIGLAIALAAARDGANIAVVAKSDRPHPKLAGTIHTAAREIEAAGGRALALACDIRDEAAIDRAVAATVEHFGGIDILVNNASAIGLARTPDTPLRRFDLMMAVNVRGTWACTRACLPHLAASARAGRRAHVLTLAPPPTLDARWYRDHAAYTIAKMGMSLAVVGHAAEFRDIGIAVNGLWPRTIIDTAAVSQLPGITVERGRLRQPAIVGDAARAILVRDPATCTGRFFLDEEALAEAGVTDLAGYAVEPGRDLLTDLFVG